MRKVCSDWLMGLDGGLSARNEVATRRAGHLDTGRTGIRLEDLELDAPVLLPGRGVVSWVHRAALAIARRPHAISQDAALHEGLEHGRRAIARQAEVVGVVRP